MYFQRTLPLPWAQNIATSLHLSIPPKLNRNAEFCTSADCDCQAAKQHSVSVGGGGMGSWGAAARGAGGGTRSIQRDGAEPPTALHSDRFMPER